MIDNENIEIQNALQVIELLKQYKSAKTQEEKDVLLRKLKLLNRSAFLLLTNPYYTPATIKKGQKIVNSPENVKLLEQYASAKNQEEKDVLFKKLRKLNYNVKKINYAQTPGKLIKQLQQAIKIDKYRPKNMSILQLAISDNFDYNGDFDTFDVKLSQMMKNKEEPKKIRERFIGGTANIYLLAKQFSADWIRRLKEHKELADAARNAKEDNAVKAYDDLFTALAKDFCKEYNCHIHAKVITDWDTSDVKPNGEWDKVNGFQTLLKGAFLKTKDMFEADVQRLIEESSKNPDKYVVSKVRVNITNIKNKHQNPNDFFYAMISVFAHEMHHALDYQNPRQGALGPQVAIIDRKTYKPVEEDKEAYHQSATEISSYEIDYQLFNQLKSMNF